MPTLEKALAAVDAQNIEVDDIVRVWWEEGSAYGSSREWTGRLSVLDRSTGWIEIEDTDKKPGHLYLGMCANGVNLDLVSKAGKKSNPFIKKAESGETDSKSPTENPFVAKARKAAMSKTPRERSVKEHKLFSPKVNPFIAKAGKS